jgi:2Fe-2S ferredoxin
MPKVTYIQPDGAALTVEVPAGTSVMKSAIANDVAGIIADCGGAMACATCHVYVEHTSRGSFRPPSEEEDEMLDEVACDRLESSRLSCQLELSDAIDAVTVRIPSEQW